MGYQQWPTDLAAVQKPDAPSPLGADLSPSCAGAYQSAAKQCLQKTLRICFNSAARLKEHYKDCGKLKLI